MNLRAWQRGALERYLRDQPKDFLAVATPGAGKTTFALTLASELLQRHIVDRIIVVVPTEHLKTQWSQAAARTGISLDPRFSNNGVLNRVFQGMVVTYAQVAMNPYRHNHLAISRRSLVILDEVHHGGDAKSWGDGISIAYHDVERRLCLTGTPFRSDDAAIPFVRYEEDGEGHLRSVADYIYGYADALKDNVVRPVVFLAYSGEARWRDSAGEEYAARLGEPLNGEQTARAWRTALDPQGDWIPAVFRAAHIRLQQLRRSIPDAGGLVIASDTTTARAYASVLSTLSSTPVTVVLSDEAGASQRIADFSDSTDEWMVAVRMVSEGVDVPRLAVGVYATSASTPLFFAQAVGRFVRSRRPGENASIFLPSVPVLLDLASKLEVARDHVLGKPHRSPEGWDDALLEDANREKNEPGEDSSYQAIGAQAELASLIYDGSTYGTAGIGEDEQEYLGLPGLLNAEQMRQLLHQRQEAEMRHSARKENQGSSASDRAEARSESTARSDGEDEPAAIVLPRLRKELNTVVSITSARTGRPHGAIHNDARRACGGPPTALCSPAQLKARIDYLRRW